MWYCSTSAQLGHDVRSVGGRRKLDTACDKIGKINSGDRYLLVQLSISLVVYTLYLYRQTVRTHGRL